MVVVMVVAVEEEGASTIETVVKPEVVKVVKPAAEATVAKLEITTLVKTETTVVKLGITVVKLETTAPACSVC